MWTWNTILFAVFPYVAILTAIVVGIYRYFAARFRYSSLSSQLMENRMLFWGSVPWHYAIIPILLAHLLGGWLPGVAAALLGSDITLFAAELTGYILGYAAIFGLGLLILRRLVNRKAMVTTSVMDWVLLAALMFQVVLGSYIAHAYRWGSLWYLQTAVPWFWSMLYLNPDYSTIVRLPWLVKAHMFTGYLIIFLFPFTRLLHIIPFPITYLWRPFQVVIWNRRSAR